MAATRTIRLSRSLLARCGAVALLGALLAVASVPLVACGTTPPPRPIDPEFDLRSPDSIRRTKAVAMVTASRDRRYVGPLIELLDDEDAAVRAGAGEALKAITGHDTGYKAYEPAPARREHQRAWRTWWEETSRGAGTGDGAGTNPAGGSRTTGAGPGYTGGSHR